jgi:hypothetical protein
VFSAVDGFPAIAEYDGMFIAWPVGLFNKLGYSGKSECNSADCRVGVMEGTLTGGKTNAIALNKCSVLLAISTGSLVQAVYTLSITNVVSVDHISLQAQTVL